MTAPVQKHMQTFCGNIGIFCGIFSRTLISIQTTVVLSGTRLLLQFATQELFFLWNNRVNEADANSFHGWCFTPMCWEHCHEASWHVMCVVMEQPMSKILLLIWCLLLCLWVAKNTFLTVFVVPIAFVKNCHLRMRPNWMEPNVTQSTENIHIKKIVRMAHHWCVVRWHVHHCQRFAMFCSASAQINCLSIMFFCSLICHVHQISNNNLQKSPADSGAEKNVMSWKRKEGLPTQLLSWLAQLLSWLDAFAVEPQWWQIMFLLWNVTGTPKNYRHKNPQK